MNKGNRMNDKQLARAVTALLLILVSVSLYSVYVLSGM